MKAKFCGATFTSQDSLWNGSVLRDQLVEQFLSNCFREGAVGALDLVNVCVGKAFQVLCPKTGWQHHRFVAANGQTVTARNKSADLIIEACVPEFVLASLFEELPVSPRKEDILHIVEPKSRIPLARLVFEARGSLISPLSESKDGKVEVNEEGKLINAETKEAAFSFKRNTKWTNEFVGACPSTFFFGTDTPTQKREKCQNLLRILNGRNATQSKRNRETVASVKSQVKHPGEQLEVLLDQLSQVSELNKSVPEMGTQIEKNHATLVKVITR